MNVMMNKVNIDEINNFRYWEYDIIKTALQLGISVRHDLASGDEVRATCPFCRPYDKNHHLYLNTRYRVFFCHRCGAQGGILHLVAAVKNVSLKEAYHILNEIERYAYTKNSGVKNEDDYNYYVSSFRKEENIKPVEYRHNVYTSLLDRLVLSDKHLRNLTERGLNREVIQKNKYKSIPVISDIRKNICRELTKYYDLNGVPGFYIDNEGDWNFYSLSGFLIPVRNGQGMIQAMQIRLDNPDKGGKYRYFSSKNLKNGTRAYSCIHIVGNITEGYAHITEGPLKADVAAYYSGEPYVAIPGINSINGLVEIIREYNVREIYEDFDMDKIYNPNVLKGVNKIISLLESEGVTVKKNCWPPKYKGIDDYYLYAKNNIQNIIPLGPALYKMLEAYRKNDMNKVLELASSMG